jgi:hypothetical protein
VRDGPGTVLGLRLVRPYVVVGVVLHGGLMRCCYYAVQLHACMHKPGPMTAGFGMAAVITWFARATSPRADRVI